MMGTERGVGPVVLAEDDPGILGPLGEALREIDLVPISARTLKVALDAVEFHGPAATVIDLAMDDGRGWELLHALAQRAGALVVALDRAGDALVRRAALAAGADDVMGAPLDPREIAARVARLARPRRPADGRATAVLRHEDLVIDVAAHEVRVAGKPVALTAQQFAILRALCEAGGATLHRSHLIARIAAVDDEPPSDRAVDLHVSRLRRRLGDSAGRPRYVEAVYGVGYRLARAGGGVAHPEPAEAVIEGLEEAIIVVDDDLLIRSANGSARRVLGKSAAELVGADCAEVMRCRTPQGTSLAGAACLGRAALGGKTAVRCARVVIEGKDGAVPVLLSHSAVPVEAGRPLVAIELRMDGA